MTEERGVEVDPSTIMRWVHCYAPELEKRARQRYSRMSAHTPQHKPEQSILPLQQEIAPKHEHSYGLGLGL